MLASLFEGGDGLADRAQRVVAARLLRAPARIVRTLVGRPMVVDDQRLDLHTQFTLRVLARSGRPPLHHLPVERARAEYEHMPEVFEGRPPEVARIEDTCFPGPAGSVGIRIYDAHPGQRARPILVWFHGGGGVIGSLRTHDVVCRRLTRKGQCLVVSVDYRLAPESPFPAAVEDAMAAFEWVVAHAERLGGDARRVAVGGDSMGGCIATVVCQLARDRSGPAPCFQLLVYPPTQAGADTPSRRRFADGFMLTADMIAWFHRHYAGDADPTDPRLSPLLADDLRGLPPAFVATAGFDPLRDEARAYAERLRAAGVPVRYYCYGTLTHTFCQLTGVVPAASAAVDDIADELRHALAT